MASTYFFNPHFLEYQPLISLANIHEYFKAHPDYDRNCINEKGGSTGVNYTFQCVHEGYILITKEVIDGDKRTALEHFIAVNEKIFKNNNLKDMLMGIEAVGADTYNMGAKTTGSILVNRMKLAGS